MEEENKPIKKLKEVKLNTLVLSISIFVFVLLVVSSVIVYRFSDRTSLAEKISAVIPFPAIIIEKADAITIREINSNLRAIRRFYEKQDFSSLGYLVDFKTSDGQKRLKVREKELINKMIEDIAIEKLAKRRGITISNKLVGESVDRKVSEYGGEEAIKESLKNLYGWSLNDFKKKVVKPSLYKEELEKWISEVEKKDENQKSRELAEKAMQRISSGENFSDVAKDGSDSVSAEFGGHLGWFKIEYISTDLQNVVASLEKNEVSEIVESNLGYHILKLDDKKTSEGETLYDLSQIYYPKASFVDWLSEEIKNMKVRILIGGYEWNEENGMVEFQDKEMEKFRKNVLEEEIKDPSLLSI